MSKFSKIIIGGGFILLVLLAGTAIFLRYLVTKSYPVTDGTIAVSGLHAMTDIYRDEYGVPHISARDEHDLMYTAGYVHAQDRLWQMDLARRVGQGRLSEVLDTSTIPFDKLFRTLGFAPLAESLYEHLHPTSRRLLEDYTDGVNEFIATHKGKFPIEFDMLNYEPEPWKPQHSILIARLMAWELNFAWWVDLTYAEIASLVTEEKFQEISLSNLEGLKQTATTKYTNPGNGDVSEFLETVRNYRAYFNAGGFSAGSNAWVIDSSKSMSDAPILANDPHLILTLPAKWYELHLTAPGWNVDGVSIPGIPLVVIGHNDSLTWGFTNAMLDDCDFFIEHEDSIKSNYYHYKSELRRMKTREETIHIGKSDSVVLSVRTTHHGPIINDVHPSAEHPHAASLHKKSPISMRWIGFDLSDEVLGFYRMNRATNRIEFEEGLKQLTVPGQCAMYADIRNNIGWWVAAKVPIRGKHNGALPLSGWTGEDEWQGYVPFEKLPKIWNPPEGFIVAANQKINDQSFQYYFSTLWEPSGRHNRIRELLSLGKMQAADFRQFQQDVVSPYSQDLSAHIIKVFSTDSSSDQSVNAALVYLRNWNYRCTPTDIASTIVNTFFVKLLHNIYEDEMGNDVFNDFVYSLAPAYRVTAQLLKMDTSSWFDDVRTDTVETKEMIVRKSFIEAINELQTLLGGEMKTWQWGKIHQAVFEHPFGNRKPLDKVFNVGPFPVGGGEQTINKGAFSLTKPYRLFAGPSMRQIVDMAQPQSAFRVITLGQSGQPMHKHYDDQVSLWLNGGYRQTTIDWDEIHNQKWEHLVLKPR